MANLITSDPFLYVWSDSFVLDPNGRSTYKHLMEAYKSYGCSILTALEFDHKDAYDKFGYFSGKKKDANTIKIEKIVEKPGRRKAPSKYASVGACLFTPDIFKYIKIAHENLTKGEELYYNSALTNMIQNGIEVHAVNIPGGQYFDTGNKLDFFKTQVHFGLSDPDVGIEFREYLSKKLSK